VPLHVRSNVLLGATSRLPLACCSLILVGCPQLLDDDFGSGDRLGGEAGTSGAGGSGSAGESAGGSGGADSSGGRGGSAIDAGSDVGALRAALTHRYGFEGFGVNPVDALGGAPGYVYNGALIGLGYVRLDGSQYVSLPNGVLSSTSDKTLEVWLTWRGGAPWQRIFDFGVSDAGEFNQGNGQSYLFLAATSEEGVMSVAYSQDGYENEVRLAGTDPCPEGVLVHVVVVVDSGRSRLSLYRDGALEADTALTQRLADIDDVNVWIGRSQYSTDPNLDADVTEFRIYDQALGPAEVALSHQLGPDAAL
jgi:hypothetical protein